MVLKPIIKWPLIILGVLIVAYLILRMFIPMTNIAETSPAHIDSTLRTRYYSADIEDVRKTLNETIPTITTSIWGGNWKIVEKGAEEQTDKQKVIKAEIPVVFFTDDMKITLRANDGRTAVDVYSASRVGKSDFGENRRHVIQIYEFLDAKFGSK